MIQFTKCSLTHTRTHDAVVLFINLVFTEHSHLHAHTKPIKHYVQYLQRINDMKI